MNLIEPLVALGVDLRDFSFTPIFRSRLFGSSFHARVSDAGWRSGLTLWLKSWDQVPAGSLPDDDIDLCRLAEFGRDMKSWKKVREEAMHGWLLATDGRRYHPVVAEGVNEAWKRKCDQRNRTSSARAARLAKIVSQGKNDGATSSVTEDVTGSVTDRVTDRVTESKGQGQLEEEERYGGGGGRAVPSASQSTAENEPKADARRIVDRFLTLRDDLWPRESGFPAPTMTIQSQAQSFLDGGGPFELIMEVMERGMRESASLGKTPTNSLAAFKNSISNAIISHKRNVMADDGRTPPGMPGFAGNYQPNPTGRREAPSMMQAIMNAAARQQESID